MDTAHLSPGQILGGIVLLGGAVTVLAGWWKFARPRWKELQRKVSAVFDSVAGRDPIIDPSNGREISPALPGIGVRMSDMEDWRAQQAELMQSLTEAVTRLADQAPAIADLERRVTNLESATTERIVNKVEAVKALEVIEAALQATPDIEGEAFEADVDGD